MNINCGYNLKSSHTQNIKNPNIFNLLYARELGYVNHKKINKFMLNNYGYNLTDKMLLESLDNFNLKTPDYKVVSGFPKEFGSILCLDFSSNGELASVSDTNRSISLINLQNMKIIGQIKNNERTAWTMAFHPADTGIIAFGSFGGQVNVFKNLELYRSTSGDEDTRTSPISSLSFHSVKFHVLFAQKNMLTIWDWENNIKLYKFEASPELFVRYIKSIPFSNKLITGIEKRTIKLNEINTLPWAMEGAPNKLNFLLNFLNNFIFDLEVNCEIEILSVLRRKFECLIKLLDIFIKSHATGHQEFFAYTKTNLNEINKSLEIINNRIKYIIKSSTYSFECDNSDMIAVYGTELIEIQLNCNNRIHLNLIYEILKNINTFIRMVERKIDENPWNISESNTIVMANNKYVLQVWDFDDTANIPDLQQNWRNTITSCYILNDSTLAISCCGKMLCSFTEVLSPNTFKTAITIHSLEYSNLGDCLFRYDLNCLKTLSISFSSSNNYLLIGVRSEHIFAFILNIHTRKINFCNTNKDINKHINCIKWAPRPSDGILIGFQDNLQLRYLRYNFTS